MKTRARLLSVLILAATAGLPGLSGATPAMPGYDLLSTSPDTHFDFTTLSGGLIGDVNFQGLPLTEFTDATDTRYVLPTGGAYPHGVDTIVHRKQPGPDTGGTQGIDIELVALSLVSVAPIDIFGFFYTLYLTLDPAHIDLNTPTPGDGNPPFQTNDNTGAMTLTHDFPNNGTNRAEGTFNSFFDVFFEIRLDPTDFLAPPIAPVTGQGRVEGSGFWTHELDGALEIPGLTSNFFPTGSITGDIRTIDENEATLGLHRVQATVPEPGTLALIGLGFGVMGWGRKTISRREIFRVYNSD